MFCIYGKKRGYKEELLDLTDDGDKAEDLFTEALIAYSIYGYDIYVRQEN